MTARRCVYTVLSGGYERLMPQHVAVRYDVDLICLSDQPQPGDLGWQIRRFDVPLACDPNRSSRRPKILPHEYLADYDESLYIDNCVLLTVDPATLFDRFLPPGTPMAAFSHSFRDTVEDEFGAVVECGKDAGWVCAEQLDHYRASDPDVLSRRPLWGGLLLRRHHDPVVRAAMQLWWEHVLRYSRRDQLSLLTAARQAGLAIAAHDVDNHVSAFHEWPRPALRVPGGGAALPPGPEDELRELRTALAQVQAALDRTATELDQAVADRERLTSALDQLRRPRSRRLTAALRVPTTLLTARRRPRA